MDELVLQDEIDKKKVSTWKRLGIFFMDTILVAALFVCLFFSLGYMTITNVAKPNVQTINGFYAEECSLRSVPYKESTFGLYEVDKEAYIYQVLPTVPTYEAAMEKCNNIYYEIDRAIQSHPGYSDAYVSFSATYYVTLLVSAFIPSFALLFLVPVLNKNRKTIGMFITKTSLAQDGTNILCSGARCGVRFLTIYAIEFAIGYVIGQIIGLGFVVLLNMLTICLTKKNKAVHDFFTQTHLELDEFTYTDPDSVL